MLTGQAKRDYQREYMRGYMRARRAVKTRPDVKTQEAQCVKTYPSGVRPRPAQERVRVIATRPAQKAMAPQAGGGRW